MRQNRPTNEERVARAFAPAHWTAIFSPRLSARDPRARGSIGAGVVLAVGVHAVAHWRAGGASSLKLTSNSRDPLRISSEATQRLLAARDGKLRVHLVHELPISRGFGMSAAGTLAACLATASVLRLPPDRAVSIAHLSELFGGGGLGGVAAILGGGWEMRTRAGIPPFGTIRHRPFRHRLILAVAGGPLRSPGLLGSEEFLADVRRVGSPAMKRLVREPTSDRLLREAERFTDELGLATPRLLRLIDALRNDGAWTAQSMLGHSLVAIPPNETVRRRILTRLEGLSLPTFEVLAAARGGVLERPPRDGNSFTDPPVPR